MTAISILVVEDEPVIALDIKHRLTQLGYSVTAIADSAETALLEVSRQQPQLILMDIHLRGKVDGIETASQIRAKFNLPVVFLTAHADPATVEQVKAAQPFGYIVKPFDTHDLRTAIEVALNRYQTEIAVQTSLERERELNDLKSRFISIVSHEFRNPLSSILFSLDLLERHNDQLTEAKRQAYFHRARASVERMRELLEEVLVIGEAEGGKLSYNPAPLNLTQFCCDLIEEFQTTFGTEHLINFTIQGVAGYHSKNQFDEKLLRHILSNLLSNAVKYSPKGSEIDFQLRHDAETVSFRIQDKGIGIPLEDQTRLFECFHRAKNARNIPGTGLGLSIVKQCVEAHGGVITVDSQVGQGTTFVITLPRQSEPKATTYSLWALR